MVAQFEFPRIQEKGSGPAGACLLRYRLAGMQEKTTKAMQRVQLLFERSGLSLEELGQRMGYRAGAARKAAWQFLRRTTDPRLSMLERFAEAVNVSLVDLIRK